MKIKELMAIIDQHVPLKTAESWDNVGLLIGDDTKEITGILTALDCTMEVIEEAISKGYNTIIAHHPLIFKGVKSLVNDGYGKLIHMLIQNDIQLIALHTNLDNHIDGVNEMLAKKLNLTNIRFLNEEESFYYKVQTYIPEENLESFKYHINNIGLAKEGNYEYCFFESKGKGQFKPVGDAHPHIGELNRIEHVNEVKVEFMIRKDQLSIAKNAIINYHPYETPVYDFIKMTTSANYGLGKIGELNEPLNLEDFAKYAKAHLNIPSVRYTGPSEALIKTVAIIGGAGIGFETSAFKKGVDVFVTGDIKHHDALDAKTNGIHLLDINHYSEYVMKEGLKDLLGRWLFSNDSKQFNIEASEINTDPFNYI